MELQVTLRFLQLSSIDPSTFGRYTTPLYTTQTHTHTYYWIGLVQHKHGYCSLKIKPSVDHHTTYSKKML